MADWSLMMELIALLLILVLALNFYRDKRGEPIPSGSMGRV